MARVPACVRVIRGKTRQIGTELHSGTVVVLQVCTRCVIELLLCLIYIRTTFRYF